MSVTWNAVPGATLYEVYRGFSLTSFQLAGTPASNFFSDSLITAGASYLYRVRAFCGGSNSSISNVDFGISFLFTDDPLIPGVTVVKKTHLDEIRGAVNSMRQAGGLPPVTYTDSVLSGLAVSAVHISEMRSALDAALSALGQVPAPFTDPSLTPGATTIRAAHIQELRDRVK